MTVLMAIHIAGGLLALPSGAIAIAARKGSPLHVRAGSLFFAAMLVLGVTATPLAWMKPETDSGLGGLMASYFVLTSWVAARRHDGVTGKFEMAACAIALGTGAVMIWGGFAGAATTPVGSGPIFALGGLCLIAGLLDLNAVLRRKLTPAQRISRHLWRMCFAFFIATGSFFLGQQDVLPVAVQGSPMLFVLAFAPFAVMLFWLARLRLAKRARITLRMASEAPAQLAP